jgi:TolB-like protein
VAAGLLLAGALVAGAVWLARPDPPPAPHEPVSVLVSDFVNKTGDPVFDGSLEQPLGIGIEGASFITSFPRRDALRTARRINPGATGVDEATARLISQRETIKVVLAGTIERAGSGCDVSVRMIDPVPGTEIARLDAKAAGKAGVLQAVGTLAAKARKALGDTVTERGRAHSGWAASAIKLGRKDEADQLYQKALALVDRMTEREKYRTLGAYDLNVAGNYEKAIENFEALVQKYPSDGAGHNNLAIAYFGTLNFTKALEGGRRVLAIYPAARSTGPTTRSPRCARAYACQGATYRKRPPRAAVNALRGLFRDTGPTGVGQHDDRRAGRRIVNS